MKPSGSNSNCLNIFSKGWNFSQDGPGNRLLYHLQGCNFCCPWCSNPEGISLQGTLLFYPDKIRDEVCPKGSIRNKQLDRNLCRTCTSRECIGKNRNEGIKLSMTSYSITELLREIESAKGLFHSGGGVTITGGEPTLQLDAVKKLLQELKTRNIHTTIETNGTSARLTELFDWLDLLIIDLKHHDTTIHKKVLGVGNEQTIANVRAAVEADIAVWLRVPLIPDFNNSKKDMIAFMQLFREIDGKNLAVELLPYHEYGKVKWEQIGEPYRMSGKTISPVQIQEYKQLFTDNNIKYINT